MSVTLNWSISSMILTALAAAVAVAGSDASCTKKSEKGNSRTSVHIPVIELTACSRITRHAVAWETSLASLTSWKAVVWTWMSNRNMVPVLGSIFKSRPTAGGKHSSFMNSTLTTCPRSLSTLIGSRPCFFISDIVVTALTLEINLKKLCELLHYLSWHMTFLAALFSFHVWYLFFLFFFKPLPPFFNPSPTDIKSQALFSYLVENFFWSFCCN